MQNNGSPKIPMFKPFGDTYAPSIDEIQLETVKQRSANDFTINYYNKLKEEKDIPEDLSYTDFHDNINDDRFLGTIYDIQKKKNPDLPPYPVFKSDLTGEDIIKKNKEEYTFNNDLNEYLKANEEHNNTLREALPKLYEDANNAAIKSKKKLENAYREKFQNEVDRVKKGDFFSPAEKGLVIQERLEKLANELYMEQSKIEQQEFQKLDKTIYDVYMGSPFYDKNEETSAILKDAINIIDSDNFKNADFERKQDIIDYAWERTRARLYKEHIGNPDSKGKPLNVEKARQEFIFRIGNIALRDKTGNFSNYAVKTKLEDIRLNIEKRLSDPDMIAASEWELELSKAGNIGLYMVPKTVEIKSFVSNDDLIEYRTLKQAEDLIKHGLAIPENDIARSQEAYKGITNAKLFEYMPFLSALNSIPNALRYKRISDKLNKGMELDSTEKLLLQARQFDDLALSTSENSSLTSMYRVAATVREMIPYMAEFMMTAGITASIEKGLTTALKFSAESGLKKVMQKALTYGIGTLAQATANPQNYVLETINRMTPQAVTMYGQEGDEIINAIESQGQEFEEAFLKAFGLNYLEFMTEMMGPANMNAVKKIGQSSVWATKKAGRWLGIDINIPGYMQSKLPKAWAMRAMAAQYMRKKGFMTAKEFTDNILGDKLGWHGLLEEYSEEFVNARLGDLLIGENPKAKTRLGALNPKNWDFEQEASTFLSVAAMQAPRTVITVIPGISQGNRIKYYMNAKNGSKTTIWINKDHRKIAIAFGTNPNTETIKAFKDLIDDKKLTEQQRKVLLYIGNETAMKKMTKDAVASAQEIDLKEVAEKGSKKEEVAINPEKQKIVASAFKELEEEGFVLSDNVPEKNQIKVFIDDIQSQIDDINDENKSLELIALRDKIQNVYDSYNKRKKEVDSNPLFAEPKTDAVLKDKEETIIEKEKKISEGKQPQGRNKRIAERKSQKPIEDGEFTEQETNELKDIEYTGSANIGTDLTTSGETVINEQKSGLEKAIEVLEKSDLERFKDNLGKRNLTQGSLWGLVGIDIDKIKTQRQFDLFKKAVKSMHQKVSAEIETRSKIQPKKGQIVVGSNVFETIDEFKSFVEQHPDPSNINIVDQWTQEKSDIIDAELKKREEAKINLNRAGIQKNNVDQPKTDQKEKEQSDQDKQGIHNGLVTSIEQYNEDKSIDRNATLESIKNDAKDFGYTVIEKDGKVIVNDQDGNPIKKIKKEKEPDTDKPKEKEYTIKEKKVLNNNLVDKLNAYNKETDPDTRGKMMVDIRGIMKILGYKADITPDGLFAIKNKKGNPISKIKEPKTKTPSEKKQPKYSPQFRQFLSILALNNFDGIVIKSLTKAKLKQAINDINNKVNSTLIAPLLVEVKEMFDKDQITVINEDKTKETISVAEYYQRFANTVPIKAKYKGKVIYVSPFSNVENLLNRDDVVYGNNVLRQILVDMGYGNDPYIKDSPGLVAFKNKDANPDIVTKFKAKLKEYAAKGLTVISENQDARDIAEVIVLKNSSKEILDSATEAGKTITEKKAIDIFESDRNMFIGKTTEVFAPGSTVEDHITLDIERPKTPQANADPFKEPLETITNAVKEEVKKASKEDIKKSRLDRSIDILESMLIKDAPNDPNSMKLIPDEEKRQDALKQLYGVIEATVWNGIIHVAIAGVKANKSASKLLAEASKSLTDSKWFQSFETMKGQLLLANFKKHFKVILDFLIGNRLKDINEEILKLDKSYLNNESNQMHSMTWNRIWRAIAKDLGVSRDQVEKEMIKLSINYDFSVVKNVQDYHDYIEILLEQSKSDNSVEGKIFAELASLLDNINLDQAVSLFAYYDNINLVSEYAINFSTDGNSINMLNSTNKIEDYFNTFKKSWRNYKYKGEKGFKAIEQRIGEYKAKRAFDLGGYLRKGNILTRSKYEALSEANQVKLKKNFFEEDLQLLEDITGIKKDDWRKYFSKQTKETFAQVTNTKTVETEFDTYDQLMEHETYRYDLRTATYFKRFEPTIVINLILALNDAGAKNKQKIFENYFIKGNANRNVLSNLYKLATIPDKSLSRRMAQVEKTALSGKSLNGNRFSSIQQTSNLFRQVEALVNADNELGQFYRNNGITPEIIMLNGIGNKDNRKRSVDASNMSNEDILLSDMAMFLSSEDNTYNHNLGQFGDKPKIAYLNVKKHDKIDQKWIDDNFPDFNDELESIIKTISGKLKVYIKPLILANGHKIASQETIREVVALYLYNYLKNQSGLFEFINGDFKDYKEDFTAVVKRGGSMYSPGWVPNSSIEGGIGEKFSHAVAVDFENMYTDENFNGVTFMLGESMEEMALSMGSIYSKLDVYDSMTSIKALVDYVKDNHRTLIKTNWLNIDTMVKSFGENSKFGLIKKFMVENNLKSLSFTSGAKLRGEKPAFVLFDKEGNISTDFNKEKHQFDIETRNFLIQQDLRHNSEPTIAKQTSQLRSNIIGLQHGFEAMQVMNDLQEKNIDEYIDDFYEAPESKRIEWIKKHVNKIHQQRLIDMLDSGIGIEEPALRGLFRTMLAASITRDALEIPINRATTQEIPALDTNTLKPLRKIDWKGKTKVLLPQIASSIAGLRYPSKPFKSRGEAVHHIQDNPGQYADMFTLDGTLKVWEIEDNIIPGEYIISTRVPSDGPHSHTLGRATIFIENGNFTMLDIISQLASGSDFDGDQRFNQVMIKNKNGEAIVTKNSKAGMANYVMKLMAEDYTNENNFERIISSINTNRFDPLIEKLSKKKNILLERKNGHLYPSAYFDSRGKNMVGAKMKSIMTDITVIFSFLSATETGFKKISILKLADKNIYLKGILGDRFGVLKAILGDLLNMAYDNAKDPKIEYLGLNEITGKMFSYLLMSNKDLNKITNIEEYEKALMDYVEDIANYFNSDLLQDFIQTERIRAGANRAGTIDQTKQYLLKKYPDKKREIENLFEIHTISNDLFLMRKYLRLNEDAPKNSIEYYEAKLLQNRIESNKLKLLDTSKISGKFEFIYKNISKSLDAVYNTVFSNSFEYSPAGSNILNALYAYYLKNVDNKRDQFKSRNAFQQDIIPQLIRFINRVAIISAINKKESIKGIDDRVVKGFEKLKEKYPDNVFLDYIDVKISKNKQNILAINDNFLFAELQDQVLEDIKESFDSLPMDLKMDFAKYAIYQYGASETTSNGNYYSLLSNDIRKTMSEMVSAELEKWNKHQLSEAEEAEIFAMIAPNMKFNAEFVDASFDYDIDISFDELEIEGLEPDDPANTDEFKLQQAELKKVNEKRIKEYNQYKKKTSSDDVKNMMAQNAISEAMATEDPQLQSFIQENLAKAYPGVKFFTDREAFVEHVQNNYDRGYTSDMIYIGHAIGNAVFIDPNSSTQITIIHEYAHVYWDALPDNSKVKKALIKLFKSEFPELDGIDLEEKIIETIAKAGYEKAKLKLRGSTLARFKALLKQFWGEVKALFGNTSKDFLANKLAEDIWNNRAKINPSTFEGQQIVKNMINPNLGDVEFDGKNGAHIYRNGSRVYLSSTQTLKLISSFDQEKMSIKVAGKEASEFHQKVENISLTDEEKKELIDSELESWNKTAIAGTAIHAISEEVFSNGAKPIDPDQRSILFTQAYESVKKSLEELKASILKQYPNATFKTEEIISSEQYNVAGMVDLIVDIGNNKLIVYDIKTMEYDPNTEQDEYSKAYGVYSAPLQGIPSNTKNKHMLQTNIYTNILEEAGNEVVDIYIVPIVRTMMSDGRVRNAEVKAPIKANNTKQTRLMAKSLMVSSYKNNQKSSLKQKIYLDKLIKNGYDSKIAEKMASVYFEFLNNNIELSSASFSDMERMRGTGTGFIINQLSSLGYTEKDIESMNFEKMLYAAMLGKNKDEIDLIFSDQPEKTITKRTLKHYSGKAIFYFKGIINGKEYYARQALLKEIKKGDFIVEIYNVKEKGKNVIVKRIQKVEDVLKEGIIVEGDSKQAYIPSIKNKKSYLLVVDPKNIPENIIGKYNNEFRQVYENEKKDVLVEHIKPMSINEFQSSLKSDPENYNRYLRQMRATWKFFSKYNTLFKINELLMDKDLLAQEYMKMRIAENKTNEPLIEFLKDAYVNHILSEYIRKESKNVKNGETIPIAYMAYQIFNNTNEGTWEKVSGFNGIDFWLPARFQSIKQIPIHFITNIVEKRFGNIVWDEIMFDREYSNLRNKIKSANISEFNEKKIYTNYNGKKFYVQSNMQGLKPLEKEYLEMIEKYYNKYNRKTRNDAKNLYYKLRIPVGSIFLQKQEFNERFPKIGKNLYNKLKPSEYDNTLVKLKGTNIELTLREIKAQFVKDVLTPGRQDDIKEWLGSSGYNWINNVTAALGINTQAKLDYYIQQAKKNYNSKSSSEGGVLRKQESIFSKVDSTTLVELQTENYIDAEQKVIKSLIKKHYTEDVLPLMDYMRSELRNDKDMIDWLDKWVNMVVFNQRPSLRGDPFQKPTKSIENIVNVMLRISSLNKIAWSFKTQGANLAIGQVMDFIREPEAWAIGIARFMENPNKAMNIAKRYGLANITDEDYYDYSGKFKKAADAGYWAMEKAEKLNQVPILMGLMTKDEYNNFNTDASTKNSNKDISEARIQLIKDKVQSIHGDYSILNSAPGWENSLMRLALQFKKYIPATLHSEFGFYRRNRSFHVEGGIVTTAILGLRILINNLKTKEARLEKAKKIFSSESYSGDIDGMGEYLAYIIEKTEGKRIGFKDLSVQDRKNLMSFALQVGIYALFMLLKSMYPNDPEEVATLSAWDKIKQAWIAKLWGDIYFYIDSEEIAYAGQNIFPAVDLIVTGGKVIHEIGTWERYSRDTKTALRGWPKWTLTATHMTPYGSATRQLLKTGLAMYERNIDIEQNGVIMNKEEVKRSAAKYDYMIKALKANDMGEKMLQFDSDYKKAMQYATDEEKMIEKAFRFNEIINNMTPEMAEELKVKKEQLRKENEAKKKSKEMSPRKLNRKLRKALEEFAGEQSKK